MAKINWHKAAQRDLVRKHGYEIVETEYQQKVNNKKSFLEDHINLGKHKNHKWEIKNGPFGPHARKAICITCNNKFISWLPKA